MRLKKFQNLEEGTPLILHKKFLKFYKNNAWDLNKIGNVIPSEKYAIDFMMRKMLGMNIPYSAKLIQYSSDVGDGPGGLVEIKFNEDLKFQTWISYKDIKGVIL